MNDYANKMSGERKQLKQKIVALEEEARAADRLLEKRERWWAKKVELLDAENAVLREADNACPCPPIDQAESDLTALKREVEELKEFRDTGKLVAELIKTTTQTGANIRGLFADITNFKKSQKEFTIAITEEKRTKPKTLHIFYNEHGASLLMVADNLHCIICGKSHFDVDRKTEAVYIIDGSRLTLCSDSKDEKKRKK